jgi:hypothetical protein
MKENPVSDNPDAPNPNAELANQVKIIPINQ